MLRISISLCIVSTAVAIIVTDPLPSPSDYKYSYDIQDPTTGDTKSQHEVRLGDVVSGAYTVVGPDGTKRRVEYTADAKHGFNAVLTEEPANPAPVPTQPPTTYRPPIMYNPAPYDIPRTVAAYVPVRGPVNAPVHAPMPQYQPKINYNEEKPVVYFTPQNEIEPRAPYQGGHYFIPASDNAYN